MMPRSLVYSTNSIWFSSWRKSCGWKSVLTFELKSITLGFLLLFSFYDHYKNNSRFLAHFVIHYFLLVDSVLFSHEIAVVLLNHCMRSEVFLQINWLGNSEMINIFDVFYFNGFLLFNGWDISAPRLENEEGGPTKLNTIMKTRRPRIVSCGPPPGISSIKEFCSFILTFNDLFEIKLITRDGRRLRI